MPGTSGEALLEQCDVNLMMGGEGVEDCRTSPRKRASVPGVLEVQDCSRCVYASLGSGRRREAQPAQRARLQIEMPLKFKSIFHVEEYKELHPVDQCKHEDVSLHSQGLLQHDIC